MPRYCDGITANATTDINGMRTGSDRRGHDCGFMQCSGQRCSLFKGFRYGIKYRQTGLKIVEFSLQRPLRCLHDRKSRTSQITGPMATQNRQNFELRSTTFESVGGGAEKRRISADLMEQERRQTGIKGNVRCMHTCCARSRCGQPISDTVTEWVPSENRSEFFVPLVVSLSE